MSTSPQTHEIDYKTPLVFLDLLKNREMNSKGIESAIECLKTMGDETDNIKERLREEYELEQKGFLYYLYNALLVERKKSEGIHESFKVVMNALQTVPYYLYSRDIKPLLTDKNLIEMKRDNVVLKDFRETYYYTFRFCFYLLPSEAGPLPPQMPEIYMSLFWIPYHPCQRD